MKPIPHTKDALVLRTDFADDAAWDAICVAIRAAVDFLSDSGYDGTTAEQILAHHAPFGEFQAHVDLLSDPEFDGATVEQILELISDDYDQAFIAIVDRVSLSHPERPILVVDLWDEPGRAFRVIPSEMWGVENNLSLGNMFFSEFADNVDPDGIFRGFPRD